MRIKINGDWAAPIVFVLTSGVAFAWARFASVATIDFSGDPVTTSHRTVLVVVALAGASGIFAIACAIAAALGRSVPEGSTWESWKNAGMDVWGIIGSVGLLLFGGGMLVFLLDEPVTAVRTPLLFLMGLGFLWAAVTLTLGARIVAFAPDGTVVVLRGKPFAFFREEYRAGEFTELRLTGRVSNAGGIYAYHPDTIYSVWGIHDGRPIELSRTTVREDVQEMVDAIANKTGLPAPPLE